MKKLNEKLENIKRMINIVADVYDDELIGFDIEKLLKTGESYTTGVGFEKAGLVLSRENFKNIYLHDEKEKQIFDSYDDFKYFAYVYVNETFTKIKKVNINALKKFASGQSINY